MPAARTRSWRPFALLDVRRQKVEHSDFVSRFNALSTPKEVLQMAEPLGAEITAQLLFAAQPDVNLLGSCLGHHHAFFKKLVQEYAVCFDFADMEVVTALRHYLWRFRLPGESAQIERILEAFARAFFRAKPPSENPFCGWYTRQPTGERCCIQCGATEEKARGDKDWLKECQGCQCVTFCHPCRKRLRAAHGHAIGGTVGYGRACVAARRERGLLKDGILSYAGPIGGNKFVVSVEEEHENLKWERVSPFRSEDSVMVLCYSIIMLTTNLHSDKVKQKMKKHEFIAQNKGINDKENFPGDFLSDIYDDIAARELEVMKS
ncbi:hypothetical protein AB1Y20_001519 [Prymnesium parvum]|uniref:SEC7 domain-containing protein n=1 Tax=Prymnesium parvum TaxID=97485 RepID=A0AB34KDJ8_PRYPA